jgi:hypothetical protein
MIIIITRNNGLLDGSVVLPRQWFVSMRDDDSDCRSLLRFSLRRWS